MTYSVVAETKRSPDTKKPAAAKRAPPKRADGSALIDSLLERVRVRGEVLSADIKDLLARIG